VRGLVVSTFAFLTLSYYLKRWADDNDLPRGMTRSTSILVVAGVLAYGVAWLVDKLLA
jgi:asparagine N-glycosylation enzyme membrane subunit Stt3